MLRKAIPGGLTISVLVAAFVLYAIVSGFLLAFHVLAEADRPANAACAPCGEPLGSAYVVPECGLPPSTPPEVR